MIRAVSPCGRSCVRYAAVIRMDLAYWVGGLAFGPEGRFLVTSADSKVSLWPLEGSVPPAGHTVFEAGGLLRRCRRLAEW